MLELNLNYLRKARIWFKQNDELLLGGNNVDKESYSPTGAGNVVNTTVIIELLVPRGARNIYGLLGADCIASTLNSIDVAVTSGNVLKPGLLSDSLAGKMEPVQLCLPDEFRTSVLEEIKLMFDNNELKLSGKLDYHYGAFSAISSNKWIFRKLAKLTIKLFSIPEKEISADLINRLIDE